MANNRHKPDERVSKLRQVDGHCQTNLSGPAKGAGLRRSGRQLPPIDDHRRSEQADRRTGVFQIFTDFFEQCCSERCEPLTCR